MCIYIYITENLPTKFFFFLGHWGPRPPTRALPWLHCVSCCSFLEGNGEWRNNSLNEILLLWRELKLVNPMNIYDSWKKNRIEKPNRGKTIKGLSYHKMGLMPSRFFFFFWSAMPSRFSTYLLYFNFLYFDLIFHLIFFRFSFYTFCHFGL